LTVQGVFNAGAATVGRRTVLVLRVAERARTTRADILRVPSVAGRGPRSRLTLTTYARADRRYRFTATVVRARATDTVIGLTSLSHLRLAWSDDGVRFRVAPTPWLFPSQSLERWGCEDARVTRIGDTFWVTYTAVSARGISAALASTGDFRNVTRHGVIFAPGNRNVCLFPMKIGGAYGALHRPMPASIGETGIWWATSPDLRHWGGHRVVAGPRPGRWDGAKIGGGAPPIRTKHGWLAVYHGVDDRHRYHLGALLLDAKAPWKVRARSRAPLLTPTMPYERRGFTPTVCFTCGVLERGGDLWIYYGAADRVLALATVPVREVLRPLARAA
jgi:predicted GH43/DUF377 family glycosyl hydrolase